MLLNVKLQINPKTVKIDDLNTQLSTKDRPFSQKQRNTRVKRHCKSNGDKKVLQKIPFHLNEL